MHCDLFEDSIKEKIEYCDDENTNINPSLWLIE